MIAADMLGGFRWWRADCGTRESHFTCDHTGYCSWNSSTFIQMIGWNRAMKYMYDTINKNFPVPRPSRKKLLAILVFTLRLSYTKHETSFPSVMKGLRNVHFIIISNS